MDLVLVTGAGASHNLGAEDSPLPLMPEWSDVLCSALHDAEPGLAARCNLATGLSSEEFEKALGELFRWEAMHDLNQRFANLTDNSGQFQQNDNQAAARLVTIRRVINNTLYEQFGKRVDEARATAAYVKLFDRFGVDTLVLATTNYDRSCEAALSKMAKRPDAGFRSEDSEHLEVLDVVNLVDRAKQESKTPCLHLHGAVGWYLRDGIVSDHKTGQDYNETLGSPVVLYPDPEKDPTSDAHVAALWEEFRVALKQTSHVLVLGHSLHDPVLTKEIRAANVERVGVAYYADDHADEQRARIADQLPEAIPIQMDFGPQMSADDEAVEAFKS